MVDITLNLILNIVIFAAVIIVCYIGLSKLLAVKKMNLPKQLRINYWLAAVLLLLTVFVQYSDLDKSMGTRVVVILGFMTYAAIAYLLLTLINAILVEYYLVTVRNVWITPPLRKVLMWVIYAIVLLILAYNFFHFNPLAMVAIPTVATAGIMVALQDPIKRFIASVILSRVVRIGEWISYNGMEGKVENFTWGMTFLRLWNGSQVVIPNNTLQASQFCRLEGTQRVRVEVKTGTEVHPEKVKRILLSCLPMNKHIVQSPVPPYVWIDGFEDYYIKYSLYFFVDNFEFTYNLQTEVQTNAWYAFKREGVEIPVPQQRVGIIRPKEVSPDIALEQRKKLLKEVELFNMLDDGVITEIAGVLEEKIFAPGETIILQGGQGEAFYIILDGKVEVLINTVGGMTQKVAELITGNYFGEMSLLTGEPCTATVRALKESVLLVLNNKAFRNVLEKTPSLADTLGAVLEQRAANLEATKENVRVVKDKVERQTFSQRIRNFFGLGK
ncbi:MAG: mechanosensitive ion channel family protein [Elusimicrobiota bacterium]